MQRLLFLLLLQLCEDKQHATVASPLRTIIFDADPPRGEEERRKKEGKKNEPLVFTLRGGFYATGGSKASFTTTMFLPATVQQHKFLAK